MKNDEIKAVEMVRRIRDENYERLKGKSPGERIAFYREKARLMNAEAKRLLQGEESV